MNNIMYHLIGSMINYLKSGSTIGHIAKQLTEIVHHIGSIPGKLLIHVGTNNWSKWQSSHKIATSIGQLLQYAKFLYPQCIIAVSGILRRRD